MSPLLTTLFHLLIITTSVVYKIVCNSSIFHLMNSEFLGERGRERGVEEAEDDSKTCKEIRDKEANVFLHNNWAHNSQHYQITLPSHSVIHGLYLSTYGLYD